jgi:PAS domain S-box-containing protein
MNEIDRLKKIVSDQTRMLQDKNRLLSELEYQLKKSIVSGSRKEDLAKYQFQLSRDTIEGQASLLKTILGSIPMGLMVVDTERKIISYNQAAEEMLGAEGKEMLGKPCSSLFGEHCRQGCLFQEALKSGEAQRVRELRIGKESGGATVLSLSVAPIRNSHGKLIGGVEIFSDVTESVTRENTLRQTNDNLVLTMTRILEKKDDYIMAHSERVHDLALKVAAAKGMSNSGEQRDLSYASLLHDIGLISVPDEVLSAKRDGSRDLAPVIRSHPVDGEWLLHSVDGFDEIKKIVRSHHERFDGSGYPDGLSGEQIPLGSRIIGLVEAYDAMRNDEATERRAEADICHEIQEQKGSQFDPDLVDIFLSKVVGDER